MSERPFHPCACGCGQLTQRKRYLPSHQFLGKKQSPETVAKRAAAIRARLADFGNPLKGRTQPREQVERARLAHLGFRHTEETKAQLSRAHTGKRLAPEHIATIQATKRAKRAAGILPRQRSDRGVPLSPEHRAAISRGKMGVPATPSQRAAKTGPRNPLWRGGFASELKRWAAAIKRRSDYTCEQCGTRATGRHIHAHHIQPYRDFPALRYDLSNGLALCSHCHRVAHPRRSGRRRRVA